MNYIFHLFIYLWIYMIIAHSLNLVIGWMGRVSLAHAGFVAVGAYTYAIISVKLGWGLFPTLLIVLLLGAFSSLLLSIPSWRFRGDYFIMITLAVHFLLYGIAHNWFSPDAEVGTWANLTNGPFGIPGISKPAIFGYKFATLSSICVIYAVLFILFSIFFYKLTNSAWGRLLKCIRDDELAIRGLGKPVRWIKIQAFAISGALAALGGVMYAAYIGYIDPTTASLDESILWVSVVIVGGLGTFRGSVVGAIIILLIPELLRLTPFPDAVAANLRYLAYGLLLVLMMHIRPQGIAGEYRMD